MSEINVYDYAVDKVAKALILSNQAGESVALSWEGNAGFNAFKLLDAAREKINTLSKVPLPEDAK